MHKLEPHVFRASKRAFLIKLLSALGFGGMMGFCLLGCYEITVSYGPPPVEDKTEQVDEVKKRSMRLKNQGTEEDGWVDSDTDTDTIHEGVETNSGAALNLDIAHHEGQTDEIARSADVDPPADKSQM